MNKPSVFFKLHEWAADNFESVQYPNVKAENNHNLFKPSLPFHQRVGLLVLGFVLLLFCTVALFFLGVLFWAIFTA